MRVPTPGPVAGSPRALSATTDRGGKFSFKDLDEGAYTLAFESNGYVRQEYGQRTFPGNGSTIELSPGQARRDLVVRMTPTGSVSGHIRDRDGQPLGVPHVLPTPRIMKMEPETADLLDIIRPRHLAAWRSSLAWSGCGDSQPA